MMMPRVARPVVVPFPGLMEHDEDSVTFTCQMQLRSNEIVPRVPIGGSE